MPAHRETPQRQQNAQNTAEKQRRTGKLAHQRLAGLAWRQSPFSATADCFNLLPEPKRVVIANRGHSPEHKTPLPTVTAWLEVTLGPVSEQNWTGGILAQLVEHYRSDPG